MSETIAVPQTIGDRLEAYSRQQRELVLAAQVTVDTAAQALGVPDGWQYDHAKRAFVPQPTPQGAPEGVVDEPS